MRCSPLTLNEIAAVKWWMKAHFKRAETIGDGALKPRLNSVRDFFLIMK